MIGARTSSPSLQRLFIVGRGGEIQPFSALVTRLHQRQALVPLTGEQGMI